MPHPSILATQPHSVDLDNIDLSYLPLFSDEDWRYKFAHLRSKGPLHYQETGQFGPFWSVLSHAAIPKVELRPDVFSLAYEHGGIGLMDTDMDQGFVSYEGQKHRDHRRVVTPAFEPAQLKRMAESIRQRTGAVLDGLPEGEEFDWADRVAVEITTQMLARLMDFEPWEERRRLTAWSEWSVNTPARLHPDTNALREQALGEMADYFGQVMEKRRQLPPSDDLVSRIAHSDTMANLSRDALLGNLTLLIVGGNDTTKNSMCGMIIGFNRYPDEWRKLQEQPEIMDNAVMEIIRWQTPLPAMRRTCLEDFEIEGRTIRKGEKIVSWYASANRDEAVFDDADRLWVDRPNARDHLSFGVGVHRCAGARLGQLQLRIILEEMIKRRMNVEVVGEPVRDRTGAVNGIVSLPVRMTRG